jgi:hypothetical protein
MRSIAFASVLEKCHGDGGRCPPFDRIDDGLDLLRHLRSDRSPSWDFPSPSARPGVCFPIYFWAAYTSTQFRPIKFLCDELSIPTQNRIGPGRCRHLLQRRIRREGRSVNWSRTPLHSQVAGRFWGYECKGDVTPVAANLVTEPPPLSYVGRFSTAGLDRGTPKLSD